MSARPSATAALVLLAVLAGGLEAARGDCRMLPDSLAGARVVDDADATLVEVTAYWIRADSSAAPGAYAGGVLHDAGGGPDGAVRVARPYAEPGRYEIFLCAPPLRGASLATNVPVQVRHAGGSTHLTVDQRARAGTWVSLGTYGFEPGTPGFVALRNDTADGHVVVDAVAFRSVGEDLSFSGGAPYPRSDGHR